MIGYQLLFVLPVSVSLLLLGFGNGLTVTDDPFVTLLLAFWAFASILSAEVQDFYSNRFRGWLSPWVLILRGDLAWLGAGYVAYLGEPQGRLTLVLAGGAVLHFLRLAWLARFATAERRSRFLREQFGDDGPPAGVDGTSYGGTARESIPGQPAARSRTHVTQRATCTFEAIVGMTEVKQKLLQAARDVTSKRPGQVARNGILLNGEPGNGKTLFAEALAGELSLPFLPVSIGDVASKWLNQTTEQVMKVFADARAQAPCLLFLDEIDSLLGERHQSSDSEADRVVNTLLTELVKIRRTGVMVMAATNHLERLDPAAIREGRFDFKIEIPAPDEAARLAILSRALHTALPAATPRRGHHEGGAKGRATGRNATVGFDEAELQRAAARWAGFSAARLTAIAQETPAALQRLGATTVTFDVLLHALRSVQGRAVQLPEHTPTLAQFHLAEGPAHQLNSLAQRMTQISRVEELGGRVPRGVLFHGEPGTGKTLTARALAKTSGWAFLAVTGGELIRDPGQISRLMKQAADWRPCIVFIDEADDVLADRASSPYATITNTLLTAMDGAAGAVRDVIFIAATNFPERLDEAALRGGRFSEKVEFPLPELPQIQAMVAEWQAGLSLPLAADCQPQRVAPRLQGLAQANIAAVLQAAVDEAVGRGLGGEGSRIGLDDIERGRATLSI